jgi:hypothetical protein
VVGVVCFVLYFSAFKIKGVLGTSNPIFSSLGSGDSDGMMREMRLVCISEHRSNYGFSAKSSKRSDNEA